MAMGSLLAALGTAAVTNGVKASARRAARRAAFAAATGLFLAIAFGFALAALTVWIAGELGIIAALLIIAGGALVVALIVYVAGNAATDARPARARVSAADSPFAAAAAAGVEAGEESAAGVPPAGSTVGSMAVIALVGFILAQQLLRKR
ncbi:MAG TPA: hypothetical protein PKA74_08135 [Bauldia sp.]|nr:hypothetical protein [Bauldia sp.]